MRFTPWISAILACGVCHIALAQAADPANTDFVTVQDAKFYCHGKPYYFIGTNYWYGPLLASPGETGDRKRLAKELDFLAAHGLKNLRILAGAEGPDDQPYRVTPGLQEAPGKYNDDLLAGLDFLLAEMGKRDMKAVLYLNNTWEWSGGYAQYVNWTGHGDIPYPLKTSWPAFQKYAGQFHDCPECIEAYFNHVRFMLGRTNQFTGVKYVDDPTIMAWQIANEPRALSTAHIPAFEKWMHDAVALFKSLDSKHLLSTGNEGTRGCEGKMDLYERLHADPGIDYLTIHIWPKNCAGSTSKIWAARSTIASKRPTSISISIAKWLASSASRSSWKNMVSLATGKFTRWTLPRRFAINIMKTSSLWWFVVAPQAAFWPAATFGRSAAPAGPLREKLFGRKARI